MLIPEVLEALEVGDHRTRFVDVEALGLEVIGVSVGHYSHQDISQDLALTVGDVTSFEEGFPVEGQEPNGQFKARQGFGAGGQC